MPLSVPNGVSGGSMLNSLQSMVRDDCVVILDRVLQTQTLTFFGEDGGGEHGRSTFPVTARIRCFDLDLVTFSDDMAEVTAHLRIFLDGYDARVTGHAITDINLRFNLDRLLDAQHVSRQTLSWAPIDLQGEDFITLSVDVAALLQW